MNILFNASQCGLGNNGGSKTIIRCAEVLQDMGHGVFMWANVDNYTWHKHSLNMYGQPASQTSFDAVVFVSVWDVCAIDKYQKNNVWYMRGWEKWLHGEDWLIQQIKKFVAAGGRIIVNSSWLIDQLRAKCGVDSVLCYSGLDLDVWKNNMCIIGATIGGLGPRKHKTKSK